MKNWKLEVFRENLKRAKNCPSTNVEGCTYILEESLSFCGRNYSPIKVNGPSILMYYFWEKLVITHPYSLWNISLFAFELHNFTTLVIFVT